MKKNSKKSLNRLLFEGFTSLDITGEDFKPVKDYNNNIAVSWKNVGGYFHIGFKKATTRFSSKEEEFTF